MIDSGDDPDWVVARLLAVAAGLRELSTATDAEILRALSDAGLDLGELLRRYTAAESSAAQERQSCGEGEGRGEPWDAPVDPRPPDHDAAEQFVSRRASVGPAALGDSWGQPDGGQHQP